MIRIKELTETTQDVKYVEAILNHLGLLYTQHRRHDP